MFPKHMLTYSNFLISEISSSLVQLQVIRGKAGLDIMILSNRRFAECLFYFLKCRSKKIIS